MNNTIPRIVIAGGGAGGLELATRLGKTLGKKRLADIILIDARLTHIWKPLLHEVAAGTINSYEDELNYFAHANSHWFEFHLGYVCNVDRVSKEVVLAPLDDGSGKILAPERRVKYDTLVISIGSQANDFGTHGAREHCMFLDSRPQADLFHKAFLNTYLAAEAKQLQNPLSQKLNIAIIGAGATGVELAAELHHAAHEFSRYGLDSIHPEHVTITLIEAANRVLPGLPEKVSNNAIKQLTKMGIHVKTSTKVIDINEHHIVCEGGLTIDASLKVWSAGIKAPEILKNIVGLTTNRINQIVVNEFLQCPEDTNIYAMGDCASFTPASEQRAVPPRAQVANQQATYLAKHLQASLKKPRSTPFKFIDKGSLISLSNQNTVGHLIGHINIQGFMARMMYVSLYRLHQLVLHGPSKTSIMIAKDTLAKRSGPSLKLH